MNQMNPVLFQQQMIYNMQYRKPMYNNRQQQPFQQPGGQGGGKGKKQDEPEVTPAVDSQNDGQLQQQLEYILKLQAEQDGIVSQDPSVQKQ